MADAKTEKQKVKEITDKLEEGLKELFESGKYKNYLSTMSKFHNYSVNNTLLIALQRPDASLVAGYQAWQKNFNRHVNKGERGIRILAPAPYKIKEERDKLDPVTGEVMLDKDGSRRRKKSRLKSPLSVPYPCLTYRRRTVSQSRNWRQKSFCPRWRDMRTLLRRSHLLPRFRSVLRIFPAIPRGSSARQKNGLRCRRA